MGSTTTAAHLCGGMGGGGGGEGGSPSAAGVGPAGWRYLQDLVGGRRRTQWHAEVSRDLWAGRWVGVWSRWVGCALGPRPRPGCRSKSQESGGGIGRSGAGMGSGAGMSWHRHSYMGLHARPLDGASTHCSRRASCRRQYQWRRRDCLGCCCWSSSTRRQVPRTRKDTTCRQTMHVGKSLEGCQGCERKGTTPTSSWHATLRHEDPGPTHMKPLP